MEKTIHGYTMEELLPVVAELTKRFTSNESSSITYEKANQLMEAVKYCIDELYEGNDKCELNLAQGKNLTAIQAYELGYQKVLQRTKDVMERYNQMIVSFEAYGNENYKDTVEKAIPGFFSYYDVKFAPQENIITMDYPTLHPVIELSGIRAIDEYVKQISLEQIFFKNLPKTWVEEVLFQFHSGYKKEFFNLCEIVLRNILGHMLIGKKLTEKMKEEEYEQLEQVVKELGKSRLKEQLRVLLGILMKQGYQGSMELENYLEKSLDNMTSSFVVAAEVHSLPRQIL